MPEKRLAFRLTRRFAYVCILLLALTGAGLISLWRSGRFTESDIAFAFSASRPVLEEGTQPYKASYEKVGGQLGDGARNTI